MNEEIHWLFTGLIGVGGAVIAWLLNRAVGQQDEKIGETAGGVRANRDDITALKVDVAKAQSATDGLAQQVSYVRHDLRDVKAGVDGIARHIMNTRGHPL